MSLDALVELQCIFLEQLFEKCLNLKLQLADDLNTEFLQLTAKPESLYGKSWLTPPDVSSPLGS
jgi:hypothetical protein